MDNQLNNQARGLRPHWYVHDTESEYIRQTVQAVQKIHFPKNHYNPNFHAGDLKASNDRKSGVEAVLVGMGGLYDKISADVS